MFKMTLEAIILLALLVMGYMAPWWVTVIFITSLIFAGIASTNPFANQDTDEREQWDEDHQNDLLYFFIAFTLFFSFAAGCIYLIVQAVLWMI